jgi:glycosyltransferase involved in cell wall biosynthesis
MSKEILFLLGRYYPNPSPNSICVQGIIENINLSKNNITCICYDDKDTTNSYYKNIEVHKINRGILHSFMYRIENKRNIAGSIIRKILTLLLRLKEIPFLLVWPWTDPIFTYKVYKKAKELHKKKNFDIVIAVHMPISSVIVGNRMKREFPEIKLVPYFLDSLSGGRPIKIMSEKWNIRKKLRWEKKILGNADEIIVMESSRNHHIKFNSNSNFYNNLIYLDIPLLLKRGLKSKSKTKYLDETKFNIVFCGTANYPMRNIPYFINLAKKVRLDDVVFTFIGNSNYHELITINNMESHNIKYFHYINHEEIELVLQNADIFLNLGVKTPSAISGKIFEYMAYQKPIISTFSIENEACIPYLRKYPASLLIDERVENLDEQVEKLEKFICENRGNTIPFNEIEKMYYNNTPMAFTDVVIESN